MSLDPILFSPHSDDSDLFACYITQRIRPLVVVVTDCYVVHDPIKRRYVNLEPGAAQVVIAERRKESKKAAQILGVKVEFLGLKDKRPDEEDPNKYSKAFRSELIALEQAFKKSLEQYDPGRLAISPGAQFGHPHHTMVFRCVSNYFRKNHILYSTYNEGEAFTPDGEELKPTVEEIKIKNSVLDAYPSQLETIHFDAVRGKSEWFIASRQRIKELLLSHRG